MVNTIGYIEKAVENFFISTLEVGCQEANQESVEDIYTTKIQITNFNKEYSFYLCMGEPILKKLASQLLFEEEPSQDTIIDLVNESANLIVGNAKVLWEEAEGAELTLTTPEYQGFFEKSFSKEFDKKIFFQADNQPIMIGIEMVTSTETV